MPRAPRRRRAPITPMTASRPRGIRQPPLTEDTSDVRNSGPQENPQILISESQMETITSRISDRVLASVNERLDTTPIYDVNREKGNSDLLPCSYFLNDETNLSSNMQVHSVSHDLGFNVSNKTKLKIANGEYVDLASLLSKPSDPESQSKQLSISDDKIIVGPKSSESKINDIQQWTDAFLVFASIYTAAHPSSVSGILKYLHTVRLGASRSGGTGWKNYDIQFRLKKETNPSMSWAIVDQELWLLYMYSSNLSISRSKYSTSLTPNSSMKCYDFNYKTLCSRIQCPYSHLCLKCSKPHPFVRCRISSNTSSNTFNFRYGGQQGKSGTKPTQTSTLSHGQDADKSRRQQRR